MSVDGVTYKLPEAKNPRATKRPWYFVVIGDLFSIVVFSAIVFAAVNLPAFLSIIKYKLNPDSVAITTYRSEDSAKIEKYPAPAEYPENSIVIAKIGVNAPIIWDVSDEQSVEKLQQGVIQVNGSGKPNENKNVFVSGHSSNYWWKKGDYNTVFALLPQLNAKDEIFVTYQGLTYKYEVKDKIEVEKQAAIKYVSSGKRRLTLMTCVPVGTNLKRLIVTAVPVGG